MKSKVLCGNNIEVLKGFPDNHFDSIVTDPPYGIDFLGKSWDANTGALETYQECLRVLKPGGHIIAFSAARTYHHLAVSIEQAGFEIRDQIMWIYGSGFPKSQDIGRQLHKRANGRLDKQRFDPDIMIAVGEYYRHPDGDKLYRQLPDINGDRLKNSYTDEKYGVIYEEVIDINNEWSGWGTALKPAHEPMVLARKPISERNIADNCQLWGTGALNIDATRVEGLSEKELNWTPQRRQADDSNTVFGSFGAEGMVGTEVSMFNPAGRFPANIIHDGSDQVVDMFPDSKPATSRTDTVSKGMFAGGLAGTVYKDNTESAARFFKSIEGDMPAGRFPANIIHDGSDQVVDMFPYTKTGKAVRTNGTSQTGMFAFGQLGPMPDFGYNEEGGSAARFFYCPKVSRRERHVGLDESSVPKDGTQMYSKNKDGLQPVTQTNKLQVEHKGNTHPTVKPIELMKYLIKLVTVPGGRVLDPFNGSGSTGCAAVELDYDYTGIDLDPQYVAISERRIAAWYDQTHQPVDVLFREEK